MDPGALLAIVLVVYSIILHEIAHGYAALRYGDETARLLGRLSLNPIVHIDPVGTIILPVLMYYTGGPMIGWAKPVPVNPYNLHPRTQGEVVVAVAGVATNLAIALLMAVVLGLLPERAISPEYHNIAWVLFKVLFMNVALAIFNLVPIPPLDGSHVLEKFLPADAAAQYRQIGFFGIFLIMFLSSRGLLDRLIDPPIMAIVRALLHVTRAVARLHGA
jgi:Zn-dependent protease